ncbi:MAG: enoyl-CoA hydratase/isomerase family protein [Candidatus Eremiobacteraeota bacterium]|nr:enoyl-CoA hydratase/isomerase family protein [Candidatus Eremiobacteraeota bacterium]MCW5865806.1 enoyl-CoA hydratase/isomerase family protein [Candidatus Eremiobacteraeota bacterium]
MSRLVESTLGPQWIRVRLQNPPHNGLTPDLCQQLAQVLQAASANPEIRAILLDASGKSFCVGADLRWAAQQGPSAFSTLVRAMHQVCEIMLTAPKPVLCSVAGAAAGGGMSIALCADVRLASQRASFRLAYPQVAVSMDGGSSFRLPQLIGMGRTQGLLYDDRTLSAAEARELGLVHEVLHPERLEERAWQRLEMLAKGPTLAFGESKRLLNPPEWVRERLDKEAEAIDRMARTQDAARAMQSFLAKRPLHYEGK